MRIVNRASTQRAAMPYVDGSLCRACADCPARAACRSKALQRIDRDEPPYVDPLRCAGCHTCVTACPYGAMLPSRQSWL